MEAGVTFSMCLFLDEPIIRSPASAGLRMTSSKKLADDGGFFSA
jgi:hypothetical protein